MQASAQPLEPLPYHLALRDYLKQNEAELWRWFSSAKAQEDYTESLRLELLKHTYRLDATTHAELYARAEAAKSKLGLAVPVTLYQSQQALARNVTFFHIPGEAHIAFQGDVLSLLSPAELTSSLGHELAHALLWQAENGEFLVLDRVVQTMATDQRAAPSHFQTARRLQLYTEIYADRGSLLATGDLHSVVSNLVKLQTGMQQVSAESYLQQADEIFAAGQPRTEESTHPETFMRARALRLWSEGAEETQTEIERMIEGPLALNELDLLGQKRLTELTWRFLTVYLKPRWFQTESVLGQARLFFNDFQPPAPGHADQALFDELRSSDPKLQEYLCFVMLDFATRDPELERVPLAAAFELAKRLDLTGKLEELANRELRITKKELAKIKREAEETLAAAEIKSDEPA